MLSPAKFIAGAAGISAIAGMYYGTRSAPEELSREQRFDRGAGVAGASAILGGTAAAAAYSARKLYAPTIAGIKNIVVNGFAAKRAAFAMHRAAGVNTLGSAYKAFGTFGGFAAVGAGVGAAVGYYSGDRKFESGAKGAVIGTGVGVAAKALAGGFSTLKSGGKAGGVGLLGLAIGAGALMLHSKTRAPESFSYAQDNASGEVEYGGTPVADRASRMNATGDVVLGLHKLRHGR